MLIIVIEFNADRKLCKTFDNFSHSDFMKLIQIEKTRNPDDSYFDETVPVAFFDVQYFHEQCIKLPNWRAGKYVTIKLITSGGKLLLVVVVGSSALCLTVGNIYIGDKTNIDIEFVGVVGFEAGKVPTEGYDIGRQSILDLDLISALPNFTNILTRADVRIFQNCLRK